MKRILGIIGIIAFMSTTLFALYKIYTKLTKLHNDTVDFEDNMVSVIRGESDIIQTSVKRNGSDVSDEK